MPRWPLATWMAVGLLIGLGVAVVFDNIALGLLGLLIGTLLHALSRGKDKTDGGQNPPRED